MAYKFNIFTGTLDLVDNTSKIVTHELGPTGNKMYAYDSVTSTWVEIGPLVVVDINGNVIYH